MKLFCPGPVNLQDNVIINKNNLVSHRCQQFKNIINNCKLNTFKLFNIKSELYNCVFICGSGTLSIEILISNILCNHKSLFISNGIFGNRWIDTIKLYSNNFDIIKYKHGSTFDFIDIENKIKNNKYKYIFCVHHETSYCKMNEIDILNNICHKYGVNIILDCVSSVGAYDINLSKLNNIVALGFSTNKAIESYCGLSVILLKKSIYNDIGSIKSLYMNLKLYINYIDNNETPFTPTIQNFISYNKCLENIFNITLNKKSEILLENLNYLINQLKNININKIIVDNPCNWVCNFYFNKPNELYNYLELNNINIYKCKQELLHKAIQISILGVSKEDINFLVKKIKEFQNI